MKIPFATHSGETFTKSVSAERVLNVYAEAQPGGAKEVVTLIGTPGLKLFGTVGNGPIRAMHTASGVLYVVSGNDLYSVDSSGTSTLIGAVGTGSQYQINSNLATAQELFIRSDTDGYTYDGTTLAKITDAHFPGAEWVTYLDGYFIYGDPSANGRFGISALLDADSYDALDFATASAENDDLVTGIADHLELWLFGERSIEVWYNSGNADFPFERSVQAFVERGCLAKMSVVKDDNTIFWLGDDMVVYRSQQYTPQRISTHAIEYKIRSYSEPQNATGYTYTQNGHKFYALNFTEATWVYDMSTQLWHERQSGDFQRWRISTVEVAYNKNIGGDFLSGKLYELDPDTYDEDGASILRLAISPTLHAEGNRAVMPRLWLDFETGVGLSTGQGSDPQVMLQWSDDGGKTFSNEHWRTLGARGASDARVHWRRLGQMKDKGRIFKLTMSDPVKFALVGASADIQPGAF